MEQYIQSYHLLDRSMVYRFQSGHGGLGDNIKFFMMALETCMKNGIRLYYQKMHSENEKYIKLKYDIMYITDDMVIQLRNPQIIVPYMLYSSVHHNYSVDINEVFYFTEDVIMNSKLLFPQDITNYLAIHVRLGDKFLETPQEYIACKYDTRHFSVENMYQFIENHMNEFIFLCCDNHEYKVKIKEKYPFIMITNCMIGHTALSNTTVKQVLDAVTEFYLLTNAKAIFAASESGFSIMASKFNNIPLLK